MLCRQKFVDKNWSTKCPVDEVFCRRSILSTKCSVDEVFCQRNVLSTKCSVDEMLFDEIVIRRKT